MWFQNRRMKWRHSKEAQAQKDKEKEESDKAEAGSEQKESECDTEQSDSEFEEEAEQKRETNISESSKHSVIISGPLPPGTDITSTTNTVTETTASSQIPFWTFSWVNHKDNEDTRLNPKKYFKRDSVWSGTPSRDPVTDTLLYKEKKSFLWICCESLWIFIWTTFCSPYDLWEFTPCKCYL